MSIIQKNIGSHIVTYDDVTNAILSFEPSDDTIKRKEEATLRILSKKEELKQRGSVVVKKDFIDNWGNLVDNSLADLEQVWYNGAIIEATLECMEKLSQGAPVEEAYKPIDIQSSDLLCVHFGMELSGWQNFASTSVIGAYHERGQEFCDYRNNFINNRPYVKKR